MQVRVIQLMKMYIFPKGHVYSIDT